MKSLCKAGCSDLLWLVEETQITMCTVLTSYGLPSCAHHSNQLHTAELGDKYNWPGLRKEIPIHQVSASSHCKNLINPGHTEDSRLARSACSFWCRSRRSRYRSRRVSNDSNNSIDDSAPWEIFGSPSSGTDSRGESGGVGNWGMFCCCQRRRGADQKETPTSRLSDNSVIVSDFILFFVQKSFPL